MSGFRPEDFKQRIAEAADKIWEVGKRWESHPDSFSRDMKNASSELHEIRRQFDGCKDLRDMTSQRCRIKDIDGMVIAERHKTGGSCGLLLQEAHEILVAVIDDLEKPKE